MRSTVRAGLGFSAVAASMLTIMAGAPVANADTCPDGSMCITDSSGRHYITDKDDANITPPLFPPLQIDNNRIPRWARLYDQPNFQGDCVAVHWEAEYFGDPIMSVQVNQNGPGRCEPLDS